jgi:hypothetical protein
MKEELTKQRQATLDAERKYQDIYRNMVSLKENNDILSNEQ